MSDGEKALSTVLALCDKAMVEARELMDNAPRRTDAAAAEDSQTCLSSTAFGRTKKRMVFYSEDGKYKLVVSDNEPGKSRSSISSSRDTVSSSAPSSPATVAAAEKTMRHEQHFERNQRQYKLKLEGLFSAKTAGLKELEVNGLRTKI